MKKRESSAPPRVGKYDWAILKDLKARIAIPPGKHNLTSTAKVWAMRQGLDWEFTAQTDHSDGVLYMYRLKP